MSAVSSVSPVRAHPGFPDAPLSRQNFSRLLASSDQAPARSSDTFFAALILLAAVQVRHNVDSLAAFCGAPREVVARCARRLHDNGVWHRGRVYCTWMGQEAVSSDFWADVAVAEGRLCRRVDAAGFIEWAPSGHWYKCYSLTDQEAVVRPTVTYRDSSEGEAAEWEGWGDEDVKEGLSEASQPILENWIIGGVTEAAAAWVSPRRAPLAAAPGAREHLSMRELSTVWLG